MFYVTGDIHAGMDIHKLSFKRFPVGKNLTREDYVIVCGDFGLPFLPTDSLPMEEEIATPWRRAQRNEYRHWMEWLSERPFTLLWLDGNHDNHEFWACQPASEWQGGLVNVHPLADNVIHLKRGEYYDVGGTTFWVMGGAASHDKEYRTERESWWPEEIPNEAEMRHGIETLEAHGWEVDYILTHTVPQHFVKTLGLRIDPSEPTRIYLDRIYERASFKYWFCGHYHMDWDLSEYKLRILYNKVYGPLNA